MLRTVWLMAIACIVGLTTAGCQSSQSQSTAKSAASPTATAAVSQGATGKITQEEAGITFRVNMPEIKPFLEKAKPGPIVPSLMQNAVPQGISYLDEKKWILVSHYREDGKPGLISVIDMATGKMIKAVELYQAESIPYTGHAGGLTVSGKSIWISSEQKVYRIKKEDLINAKDGGKVMFAGSVSSTTRASFTVFADGILWIGEYARDPSYPTSPTHYINNRDGIEHKAWAEGYKLNPDTDLPAGGKTAAPDYILSLPDSIQGMFVNKEHVWLSQSGGRNNASTLYRFSNPLSEKPHASVTVLDTKVPLWFLDSKNLETKEVLPPMSEGMFEHDGNMYILFESGATKYRTSSSYALDRIQIWPWNN